MNKKIKKTVAITLAVSAFSAIAPTMSFNFMTTKAYADSSNVLTRIDLEKSGGSSIQVYDDDDYKSSNEVSPSEITTGGSIYYAKTSSKKIKVETSGVDESRVRIFKNTSSSTKGVKPGETLDLASDSTKTITIRTYTEDPGSSVEYSNTAKKAFDYQIKVKCTAGSSSDDDDDDDNNDDDVYLKSISLSDGSIDFSSDTSSYNIDVPESVDEIRITAKPDCDEEDYDDYDVTIDGSTVDEEDNFKKTISLDKGENKIKITVEDNDDNKRTYTLYINRGKSSTVTSNNSSNSNSSLVQVTTSKPSQWVIVNGRWQYNDSLGRPLRSQWLFDRNYGHWYYLGSDGNMQTGWVFYGNKWYYLYSDGSMAANTIINGYKVGSDGAWIS